MWIVIFQRLFIEFVLDLLYFPLWWYSGGIKHMLIFCVDLLKIGNGYLAPGLWLQNILVPMFGQTDWQGRIASFFMRLLNIIGRTIALVFWLGIIVFLFLLWIAFPVFVGYMVWLSLI
ncbi:MAG: hypothetical protein AAB932_05285 [Patescibacteria group bacterium]